METAVLSFFVQTQWSNKLCDTEGDWLLVIFWQCPINLDNVLWVQLKPNAAGTIAVHFAEIAFHISKKAIMNVNLTVAVETKNALHGIFPEMVAEIVLKKCKMASLVTVEHMNPVVQCIPSCAAFDPNARQLIHNLSVTRHFFIFFLMNPSWDVKKVDEQGRNLFRILGKWTSSCSFTREIKIGVNIIPPSLFGLWESSDVGT